MNYATLRAFGLILDRREPYRDLRTPIFLVHRPPIPFIYTDDVEALQDRMPKRGVFEFHGEWQDDEHPYFEFMGLE